MGRNQFGRFGWLPDAMNFEQVYLDDIGGGTNVRELPRKLREGDFVDLEEIDHLGENINMEEIINEQGFLRLRVYLPQETIRRTLVMVRDDIETVRRVPTSF